MENEVKANDQPLGPHDKRPGGEHPKEELLAEGPLGPHFAPDSDLLNSEESAEG